MDKVMYHAKDYSPFVIVKQTGFFEFERFDIDTKKWVDDPDEFYRVCEDCEYHVIDEAEANRVIDIIKGLDNVEDMDHDELMKAIGM